MHRQILLHIDISFERIMLFVDESFIASLMNRYGKHPVSTDGGGGGGGTRWYPPQACQFSKLKLHIHFPFEKSLIERTMQYLKDRTEESFDDYFPCKGKEKCKLKNVRNWLNLFVDCHNKEIRLK
jgi:putative transposase